MVTRGLHLNVDLDQWQAISPEVLYSDLPPGIGTYYSTWFDFSTLKRASFRIDNTTDQDVNTQLLGNGIQDQPSALEMGGAYSCPAGHSIAISVGTNDDWFPFLLLALTTTVAPSSGSVTITAYAQR
jgi:hypothetical protein